MAGLGAEIRRRSRDSAIVAVHAENISVATKECTCVKSMLLVEIRRERSEISRAILSSTVHTHKYKWVSGIP